MWQEENSRVTAELRELIDSGVNIWDFEYPSYYEGYEKKAFEQKVIDHFYMRQIGAETVARFLHFFRRTVREIMPYYIQRYKSVELMDDPEIRPLDNYNMIEEFTAEGSEDETRSGTTGGTTSGTETRSGTTGGTETRSGTTGATTTSEGSSSGTGSKTTTNSGKETEVHSDTPQGQLNLSIAADGSATLAYASDIVQRVNNDKSTESSTASESTTQSSETSGTSSESVETTGTSSESIETSGTTSGTSSETGAKTSTDTHRLTRRGNIGVTTYAQLLQGYRETFLNIDMEVINELEICFLGVW